MEHILTTDNQIVNVNNIAVINVYEVNKTGRTRLYIDAFGSFDKGANNKVCLGTITNIRTLEEAREIKENVMYDISTALTEEKMVNIAGIIEEYKQD